MAEIAVKQDQNGSTVSAKVGDSLIVELPENPTTGFRWVPGELDASIVAPQSDEFILGSNTGVGAGGVKVFRFLVKGHGSARVQLRLARAWESGVPSKLFEIHINVQ
jgi:inhibitor of cysteine peptidase